MSYLPGSSIPRPVCRPAAPGVKRSARAVPRPASPPFVRGLPRRMAALLGILLLALCGLLMGSGPARAADDFLPPEQAFADTAAMADPLTLDMHWEIAPGYYMYQDRFEVRIEDAQGRLLVFRRSDLTPEDAETRAPAWGDALRLPHGRVKYDPTFEKDMEVFHGGVTLRTALRPGAGGPLRVSVTGQGCADEGLCYPPMTKTLVLQADGGGYRAVGEQVRDRVPPPRDETPAAAAPGGAPGTDTGLSAALRGGAGAAPAGAPAAPSEGPASSPAPSATPGGPATSSMASSAAPSAAPSAAAGPDGGSWLDLGDVGMAAWLHQAPLWQILALSLALGALLSLTPCVLPMVPILLAVISGGGGPVGRARGLGLAAIYVLGMSLVYTALGVAAGLLGAGLAAWLQSPWVLGTFAVLLALFALAMLDVFTLQAPVGLQSAMQARLQRLPGGHAGGVFVMGLLSALIVGPCVAAPLAGVLLFISQTGDVVVGGAALFALAWGEGLLLLAVGAGAGALMPRAGAWMTPLKAGFGLLLLATAWWMARPLLADGLYVAGWVLLALWAALLAWSAAAQGKGEAGPLRLLTRALALMLALWGLAQGAGLLAGGRDMLRPLAPFTAGVAGSGGAALAAADPAAIRARFTRVASVADLDARLAAAGRPVMLDFYADWCVSCLEMEKFTFSDPAVAERMDRMLLLQADVTRMTDEDRALLARFDLFGPPGILFFDAGGRPIPEARVVGFRKAEAFRKVQDRVLAGG
ncbi:Cytochrome c-type biogenesis protein DsbD, protein-disulfide reductase [Castellaniella defragrans 65Phen]|uniref:Cytochrome c-type biogenesis protein DsbD, protein-disulfide reductase n=1 Tax=Castellaniella defragrans (strain DSM 12143 / CCUG 39792 / 65Phen) TaxID=1437824 RepID=W8X0X6_CASD6|nr:protein-disulfide reductase DsbD [Castellaniella defragrans]CDM22566.1 Cytochrome c-type biogenesis protein DsbD, protein-disulfide reductase [Castellaniella defragrans 65Phen]